MQTDVEVVANPIFHEWYILAIGVAAVGYLVWSLNRESPDIGNARLSIREIISSAFQKVVVEESVSIFREVDDRLPYTLSQVEVGEKERSSFDILVGGLVALEDDDAAEDPSRQAYHAILTKALGDVVVHQVNKLLAEALEVAEAPVGDRESPSGLHISFTGWTERRLELIGTIMAETSSREDRFYTARRWNTRLTYIAIFAGGLTAIPVFVEEGWAYTGFLIAAASFAVLALSAFTAAFIARSARDWLDEHAERYETGEDMMRDFSHKIGRPLI